MNDAQRILYAMTMASALGVAWWLLRSRQSRLPLSRESRFAIGFAAFIGAMLGAKLPFALEADWESLRSGRLWITDGKTILGGIFGGYLAVEVAKACLGIRTKTGDSFALPVAVAVAIGRVACFVAGCCFGNPTSMPWGCEFPLANDPPGTLRHPTQLYEVAFHVIAVCWLWMAESRGWLAQQRLKAYLMAYLVYRFLSEWLRPEARILFELTAYQLASIVLLIVLAVLWWADGRDAADTRSSPQSST